MTIFLTRKQGIDSYLVVEDNVINQRVMSQQLARLGCAKVHTADHGLEALDFLAHLFGLSFHIGGINADML